MKFTKSYKKRIFVIFIALVISVIAVYLSAVFTIPGEITLIEGEEYTYFFNNPFMVNVKADHSGLLQLNNNDIKASGSSLKLFRPIIFKSQKNGQVNLNMKIFGLIPFKTVKVDIVSNKRLIACGNTIGVKLKINGVLIIGISDVETLDGKRVHPGRDIGLKPGDLIVEINKKKMNSIDQLVDVINSSNGKAISLKYKRGSIFNSVNIQPVKAVDDKKYHIGLWVRDSTAGIGTLTFYDPDSKAFGALGHGITDIDTGALMTVDKGEVIESRVIGITPGKSGVPGELKGVFIEEKLSLGLINKNCEYGIYGILNTNLSNIFSTKSYQIGVRSQVKEGPATILSNIDGNKVDEFAIEIQKVSRQNMNGSKGMIIKIVDKRLLGATGGIVQGMSGSPIIQDGRIIGAVTHVLVNDPTRGYGIFIEGMIKQITGNISNNMEIAS